MKRALCAIVVMLLMPAVAQASPGPPLSSRPPVPKNADSPTGWHPLGPIAFTRWADGNADLWIVRADGSRLERITRNGKDDTHPAWAPRGANLVFTRTGDSGRPDLFTMHARHGRPALFLRNGAAPAWSPDGSMLAFTRTMAGNTDVFTVEADGSDLIRVTSDAGIDTDPAWGPGGSRLTFASDRDGDFDIYSADPDGSDVRPLTDDDLDQRNPYDHWTWRDIGYDQGPEEDPTWCWQTIGVPTAVPGAATSCADPGVHSYAVGTWSPFARLEPGSNGADHLWAWARDELQLTSGRRSDADPAVRPASRAVVRALTRAAGDLDLGLRGGEAWVEANGSATGADESATGLITVAPSLCLVSADEPSNATAPVCDAGSGTGSTSVYADADELAFARDTGLGFCLMTTYRDSFGEWAAYFSTAQSVGCTGTQARSATSSGW